MNEARGKIAWELHQEIIKNETNRRELMAKNAELLSKIYDHSYYHELLGDENAQWSGYLGEIQIFYSRSKVHNLVTIYKRLTEKLGIIAELWAQIPTSRLIDILPFVTKESAEEWFTKALTLTGRDWLIETRKAKGLITLEDEHKHKFTTYEMCSICGMKQHTHQVEIEAPTEVDFTKARPTFFKKPKK